MSNKNCQTESFKNFNSIDEIFDYLRTFSNSKFDATYHHIYFRTFSQTKVNITLEELENFVRSRLITYQINAPDKVETVYQNFMSDKYKDNKRIFIDQIFYHEDIRDRTSFEISINKGEI